VVFQVGSRTFSGTLFHSFLWKELLPRDQQIRNLRQKASWAFENIREGKIESRKGNPENQIQGKDQ